jgi:hypothetical protein
MTPTTASTISTVSAIPASSTPTSSNYGKGAPNAYPTRSSTTSPVDETASLYAIGIQLQSLSHEIADAAEMLASDDEDERLCAVELLESYLAAEQSTSSALSTKADRLLIFCDHLIRQAAFRKEQSQRLTALAKADEIRVTRLHEYLIKVLTTLSPDAKKFSFDTHELTSRKSSKTIIDPDLDPAKDLPEDLVITKTTYMPDRAAIKAALKGGVTIPGCHIAEYLNWTVK